jgi:hypothetical protein
VLWGTLLLGAALVEVPADGARTVLARLLPGRDATVWAWLNAVLVPLAAVVWALVGTQLVRGRRQP